MKILYRILMTASAVFFIASSALAQTSGTVTNHAFVIGKGAGQTGYTSLLCGAAQLAVGQAAADPVCQTLSGDVTLSAAGVTAIGTAKVTSAMMRDSAALSVIGRSANSAGVPADIAAAADHQVLRRSGTSIGFGSIDLSQSGAVGTSIVGVANGGTGAATFTQYGLLYGNGTGAFGVTAAMSDGQLLIGQTGAAALPKSVTGDVTITPLGVTAIGTAKVTFAMIGDLSALSVVGRSANSTGVSGNIACSAGSDAVLRESGSVLGCGTVATAGIANNAITNAKSAQMAQSTIKGRAAGAGTGDPTDLTATQATAILDNMVGDSGVGGTKGLVPAPAAGDAAASKFLKANGTWAAVSGTGDVVGPASSTDNAAARFDLATGKLIQDSALIVADTTGALSRSGNGGIPVQGTNTNDSAAAGYVGEIRQSANKNSSSTVTISNASPAIVTWTAHGLTAEQNNYSAINFTTTGALPTGLSTGTIYYITYVDANTLKVSTTVANAIAGTYVNTSSAGSGVHTAITSWPLTTTTAVNIGGISLTAGDWDVYSSSAFVWGSATNATQLVDTISQTTGTLDLSTPHGSQIFNMANLVLTGVGQGLGATGPVRVSLSATTTLFHVVRANFTVSTMTAYGSIYARRVR